MNTQQNDPAKFVTCPCQHCNGHIEFEGAKLKPTETEQIECPHCGLETTLFLPQTNQAKQKKEKTSSFEKHRKYLPIVLGVVFFSILVYWLISKHPETGKQIAGAFFALFVFGIFGFAAWAISVGKHWLDFFAVVLFISGAISIGMGILICSGLVIAKDGTVFQEYEAIFFGLGGLIIIALSLILVAILSLKKSK